MMTDFHSQNLCEQRANCEQNADSFAFHSHIRTSIRTFLRTESDAITYRNI